MKKNFYTIIFLCITLSITGIFLLFLVIRDSEKREIPNISPPNVAQNKIPEEIQTLDDKINKYLLDNNISEQDISIYINKFDDTENYLYNTSTNFFAASIYKIPLVMIYYEHIYEGQYSLEDTIKYEDYHNEGESIIANNFPIGSYIDLQTLLDYTIIYSDNTAAHMLFENLGGWLEYKHQISKYSNNISERDFYSYDNILNANYINDVMVYLYDHIEKFNKLLKNMKIVMPNDYLKKYVNGDIAQKYGSYENATNAVGIVFGNHPYSIVIFTNLGDVGKEHIGRINQICYDYFD